MGTHAKVWIHHCHIPAHTFEEKEKKVPSHPVKTPSEEQKKKETKKKQIRAKRTQLVNLYCRQHCTT
jgi:hypothetical protein